MPGKGVSNWLFHFKGGGSQPLFFKISNWLTLKLHNFVVFHSNSKPRQMVVNSTQKFHSVNFWGPRPHNRPEISVSLKKAFFWHLVTCPPLFSWIMIKFEKICFFYLRHVHVYYNQLVQFWFNSSSLHKILIWWPRWCHKNAFFDKKTFLLQILSLFCHKMIPWQ